MTRALAVLLVLALLALAWQTHQRRAEGVWAARADSLATQILLERARADGWEVRAVEMSRGLARQLEERDAQLARLSRELQAARAQVIAVTSVEARAEGTSEAVIDSASSGPDSTVYRIADPVLSGSVTTWRDSAIARLDWTATIGLELVQAVGADGRLVSVVRADDPRVTPELRSAAWEPPRVERPSRWRWLLAGAVVGAVAWEVAR